jgi:N-ethylmaleimide reductase
MIMAPMTRSRADDKGIQNPLAETYYGQRASAGLIVTEAIAVSKQGSGYPLIPGLWNVAQAESWTQAVDAVHAKGGLIVAQLFHTGRIGHSSLFGEQPVAPSAIEPDGQVMTAAFAMEPFESPRALETHEIPALVESFRNAALNAKVAGFDGIEIHAANGYIIDQFLRDGSNHREDAYGGSVENRARLLLEIVGAVVSVFGAGRVGVRLSPTGPFNSMSDSNPSQHFGRFLELLEPYQLAFVHLIDPAAGGDSRLVQKFRSHYAGSLITNGGFDAQSANSELEAGWAEAVAFGVPFLANPDLPERFQAGAELNAPDPATFYQGGDKGYIDYPALAQTSA